MSGWHPDPIQRWHRQPAGRKHGPKPRRCTNWRCPTCWAALDGLPFCLHCHQLTQDRADAIAAKQAA
jgi:hypothetical protein